MEKLCCVASGACTKVDDGREAHMEVRWRLAANHEGMSKQRVVCKQGGGGMHTWWWWSPHTEWVVFKESD